MIKWMRSEAPILCVEGYFFLLRYQEMGSFLK
jgi:hypothetical protein